MLNAKPARGSPVSPWLESAPKSKVRSGAYHTSLRASARRIAAIVRSEKGSRNPRSNAGQPLAETQLGYCDPGHGSFSRLYPRTRGRSRKRAAT